MSLGIVAIDPGTTESGLVVLRDGNVQDSCVMSNDAVLMFLAKLPASVSATLAIEMIASYGMAVGREVFETCVWIGRFQQAWHTPEAVRLVYRRDVKLHLCGSARAKDANIRQALLDRFGGKAATRKGGMLCGVKGDVWQALALAVVFKETHGDGALAEIGGR